MMYDRVYDNVQLFFKHYVETVGQWDHGTYSLTTADYCADKNQCPSLTK